MSNEIIKHLEFIQNIISRLNVNSFQLKGLTVAIVSALLAVYASSNNRFYILVCFFPLLIFWILDSYYLCQERKFRGLYDDVAGIDECSPEIKMFDMRTNRYVGGKYSFWSAFTSITIVKTYLSLIFLLVAIYLLL